MGLKKHSNKQPSPTGPKKQNRKDQGDKEQEMPESFGHDFNEGELHPQRNPEEDSSYEFDSENEKGHTTKKRIR